MTEFNLTARLLPDGAPFTLKGRVAWAALELVKAGERGCTPIDNPGPRWSAYVHTLRKEHGLAIETLHESHRGPFAGTHARYILRSALALEGHDGDAAGSLSALTPPGDRQSEAGPNRRPSAGFD